MYTHKGLYYLPRVYSSTKIIKEIDAELGNIVIKK